MITRFDIPKEVTNVINVAFDYKVIDVQDIYALCSQFGNDWSKLITEICEYSYCANRTSGVNNADGNHRKVVTAAESYWKSVGDDLGVGA